MLSSVEFMKYARANQELANAAVTDFLLFWQLADKIDPAATYETALMYAVWIVDEYGGSVALNAAELYEQLNGVPSATLAQATDKEELKKVVGALVAEQSAKNLKAVTGAIRRQTKNHAHKTMMDNAKGDKVMFARVPVGKTCAFCLMLASRGFEYYSEESAGKGSAHAFHDGCDCEIIATNEGIEDYDPDYLYDEIYLPAYKQAEEEIKSGKADERNIAISKEKSGKKKSSTAKQARVALSIIRETHGLR